MRITVARSGGFANIGRRMTLDSDALSADEARALAALVARLPEPSTDAAALPDAFQYDVTIDGRTWRASDATMRPELRAVIDFVAARV